MPRRSVNRNEQIGVEGLRDLARDLRKLKSDIPKGLRPAHKRVAEFVATKARTKAQSLGPADAKAVENGGLRTSGTQSGASILLDPFKVPYVLGREFGAGHDVPRQTTRGTVRGWNQFQLWKGRGDEAGYFLFPTIRETRDQQLEIYADALDDVLRPVFND